MTSSLTLFCVLFTLLNCSPPSTQEIISDYSQRIQNVVGNKNQKPYTSSLKPYPRRRHIKLHDTDKRISFLDFFTLDQCGLQNLIANRNSALGKQMLKSQKLLYEHQLALTLTTCINQQKLLNNPNEDFINKLYEIRDAKANDLSIAYWNGVFASKEIQNHFSFSTGPLDINKNLQPMLQLYALKFLNNLNSRLGTSSTLTSEEMEVHYHILSNRQYGGELLQSMDLLAFYLNEIGTSLNKLTRSNTFCSQNSSKQKAAVLNNIFNKFYVGKIQPYLARVHKESHNWLTILEELVSQHPIKATAFRSYYEYQLNPIKKTSTFARLNSANTRHVKAWQMLFDKCNVSSYDRDTKKL